MNDSKGTSNFIASAVITMLQNGTGFGILMQSHTALRPT